MLYRSGLKLLLITTLLTMGLNVMATDTQEDTKIYLNSPVPLNMHGISEKGLQAYVMTVDREPSGELVIGFLVTLEDWEQINEDELFHTEKELRSGDVEGNFEPQAPIAIEAVLDRLVVESLQLTDASPADLLARLASIKPKTLDAFLLSTRSWIARTVMQELELPPELQGTGSISTGFRMKRAE